MMKIGDTILDSETGLPRPANEIDVLFTDMEHPPLHKTCIRNTPTSQEGGLTCTGLWMNGME